MQQNEQSITNNHWSVMPPPTCFHLCRVIIEEVYTKLYNIFCYRYVCVYLSTTLSTKIGKNV